MVQTTAAISKLQNLFNQSYGVHVTSLVINNLIGEHTGTHTHPHKLTKQFYETRHVLAKNGSYLV